MKILQIIPSISLVYGGPSQMILGLCKTLALKGIDTTIITTNSNGDNGQLPLDVPLRTPIYDNGYQTLYFPCSPFRRYKFSWDLLQWLKKEGKNYDLAHIHALFSPVSTFAGRVCHSLNLPYILRPLGTLDPADLQKKKYLKKLYSYLLEKNNLQFAKAIHFTSQEECNISDRFGVKTNDFVLPLGVDYPQILPSQGKARQKWGIKKEELLFLFLSRVEPKKGLDLLIPSLENIAKLGIDFKFIIAGSNPQNPDYMASIRDIIKNSSLKEKTIFTGFIQGESKAELLRDADLFLLPSYYENFGIAVAEAMSYGTPVVISNKVYIWESIEEYQAGWVSHCTVASLTETIKLAIQSPQERKLRGDNGRKLVQDQYSWESVVDQLITIYQQLC